MIHKARHLFSAFPSSGVPIYRQLVEQVAHLVASGRLAEGDLLPSVRETAAVLEVNPMTVSRAYSLLEEEGLVERLPGTGMQVCGRSRRKDTVAQRTRQLQPLLQQVAAKAHQLALTPPQVRRAMDAAMKEVTHAR